MYFSIFTKLFADSLLISYHVKLFNNTGDGKPVSFKNTDHSFQVVVAGD